MMIPSHDFRIRLPTSWNQIWSSDLKLIATHRYSLRFVSKYLFFNTIFVSSHMCPENPEGTQVIVGSMNMGYDIYPTLPGIRTHCLFHPKCLPISLGHSDSHIQVHFVVFIVIFATHDIFWMLLIISMLCTVHFWNNQTRTNLKEIYLIRPSYQSLNKWL